MEPLQPLCRSAVLSHALLIAQGLVLDRSSWPKHNDCPMDLAVAFHRQPNMSEEDMEAYAELSVTGLPIPKDLHQRHEGFRISTLTGWGKGSVEQRVLMVADGAIGAVALVHSCPYDDHLIVEVAFRDDPECCMHTALPFGAYVPEEGDDPAKAPPRMYMHTPWRQLFMETDTFVRHPVLPRRYVPRMNIYKLWQPPRTAD